MLKSYTRLRGDSLPERRVLRKAFVDFGDLLELLLELRNTFCRYIKFLLFIYV